MSLDGTEVLIEKRALTLGTCKTVKQNHHDFLLVSERLLLRPVLAVLGRCGTACTKGCCWATNYENCGFRLFWPRAVPRGLMGCF